MSKHNKKNKIYFKYKSNLKPKDIKKIISIIISF